MEVSKFYLLEAFTALVLLIFLFVGVYIVSNVKNRIHTVRVSVSDIERKIASAERLKKELEVKRSILYGSRDTKAMADIYLNYMSFTRSNQVLNVHGFSKVHG